MPGRRGRLKRELAAAEASTASTDGRCELAVGGPGDWVLLKRDPLAVPATGPGTSNYLRAMEVAATFVAGRLV